MQSMKSLGLVALLAGSVLAQANHLLISEVAHDTPTESGGQNSSEYIEIFNPTTTTVVLGDNSPTGTSFFISDIFLRFFLLTDNANEEVDNQASGSDQFCYEFPPGTSIPPNGVVVVTAGKTTFLNDFFGGSLAAFQNQPGNPQLFDTADMVKHHTSNSLNLSLTNSQEEYIILYSWDRSVNFVRDHDIVAYSATPGNFTVFIRSAAVHQYNADQSSGQVADNAITPGSPDTLAVVRTNQIELMETSVGGNGYGGHDETTEDLQMTCETLPGTPGVVHPNLTGGLQLYEPGSAVITVGGGTIVNGTTTVSAASSIGTIAGVMWTFLSVPAGSGLTNLNNPTMVDADFVPDVTGDYQVQLIVDDGVQSDTTMITITINNTAPMMVISGANQFGSANLGTLSLTSPASWTITNNGTANLAVDAITSLAPSEFVLSSLPNLPLNVAPGGSVGFNVSFAPAALGLRSSTIRITSNTGGLGTSDTDITVTGTGTPANAPNLVVLGTTDFDAQGTGAPVAAIWSVNNTGPSDLEITSISPNGVQSGDFTVSGINFPQTLPSQTSITLTVVYTPGSTSPVQAFIRFISNSGGNAGSIDDVTVRGQTGGSGSGGFGVNPTVTSSGGSGGVCGVHRQTRSSWAGWLLLGVLGALALRRRLG